MAEHRKCVRKLTCLVCCLSICRKCTYSTKYICNGVFCFGDFFPDCCECEVACGTCSNCSYYIAVCILPTFKGVIGSICKYGKCIRKFTCLICCLGIGRKCAYATEYICNTVFGFGNDDFFPDCCKCKVTCGTCSNCSYYIAVCILPTFKCVIRSICKYGKCIRKLINLICGLGIGRKCTYTAKVVSDCVFDSCFYSIECHVACGNGICCNRCTGTISLCVEGYIVTCLIGYIIHCSNK